MLGGIIRPGSALTSRSEDRAKDEVEKVLDGTLTDLRPAPGKEEPFGMRATRAGNCEPYGADGLAFNAPPRTRDARDRGTDLDPHAGSDALGHGPCDPFRDGPLRVKQRLGDPQRIDLDPVRVGHDTPGNPLRTPGDPGESTEDESARAALGHRDPKLSFEKRTPQRPGQISLRVIVDEGFEELPDPPARRREPFGRVLAPGTEHELDAPQ